MSFSEQRFKPEERKRPGNFSKEDSSAALAELRRSGFFSSQEYGHKIPTDIDKTCDAMSELLIKGDVDAAVRFFSRNNDVNLEAEGYVVGLELFNQLCEALQVKISAAEIRAAFARAGS